MPRHASRADHIDRDKAIASLPLDLEEFADLVEQAFDDPEILLEPENLDRLAILKTQSEANFGRLRRVLKKMNLWPTGTDELVRASLKQTKRAASTDGGKGERGVGLVQEHVERLMISDTTIERAAVIAEAQPRGIFVQRDELSGWLANMSRYSKGGSDRGFWIEGYGARPYVVERMGRPPTVVDRLTVTVSGAIQPDKLNRLLLNTDDDGMLARFLPIWPLPVEPKRPGRAQDVAFATRALQQLYSLSMSSDDRGGPQRPIVVPFSEGAQQRIEALMHWQREHEEKEAGLSSSFLGKLRGIVVRLSLVLAHLDWAAGLVGEPPAEIDETYVARAEAFAKEYALPMARRAYAEASVPAEVRGAQKLARVIVDENLTHISQGEISGRELEGLRRPFEIEAALDVLIQASWVRSLGKVSGPRGGRPKLNYEVNPAVHRLKARDDA